MSEVKKIATRESYGNALVELGAEHDNLIVLDADLAGNDARRSIPSGVMDLPCALITLYSIIIYYAMS